MKILQMHIRLSQMGGIESMLIALANEMSKKLDVRVCTIYKPTEEGVYYTRLNSNIKKEHLGKEKEGFSLSIILKIFLYLKKTDADIVHLHGFFYYYALAIILLHNRIKFVYTVHSDAKKECSKWDQRVFWLKRLCFKMGWLHPVTISPESKDSFTAYYKIDSKMIKNGIPKSPINNDHIIEQFKTDKHTKVFIHPGRISEPKNQVVLCKVFKRLIDEEENVVLLIAGANQDDMIFQAISRYFCKRIQYLGERSDVPNLLSQADGFCLPSIWEGLPITLLEALSVGCIPICSPVGGIVNVIESGENGLLSKSPSEEDYYNTIKSFLSASSEDIQAMKQKCIDSFYPYDIKRCANEYKDLYFNLAKGS